MANLTRGPNPCHFADWIEALLLFQTPSVSRATLADRAGEEDLTASIDDEAWSRDPAIAGVKRSRSQRDKSTNAALVDDAISEITTRAEACGSAYPFSVEDRMVRRLPSSWRDVPVYAFLLALNHRYTWGLRPDTAQPSRMFEQLTTIALKQYWCSQSTPGGSLRFGWPREAKGKRFETALHAMATEMGEGLGIRPELLSSRHKDMGLDVVAWRRLDGRPAGRLAILCQCAIGGDWAHKAVPVEKWKRIFRFGVSPVAAVAYPFLADAQVEYLEEDWTLAGSDGIPLDRLRLARLLWTAEVPSSLLNRILAWTDMCVPAIADSL